MLGIPTCSKSWERDGVNTVVVREFKDIENTFLYLVTFVNVNMQDVVTL